MADIQIIQDDYGRFDIVIEDGDIAAEDGFDSAINASLFLDARAPESKVLLPEHRRGWIGNVASPVIGRELGGLMWLLEQRRLNQGTLNESKDYARQALQWFVDDGLCVSVEVAGIIISNEGIRLTVLMTAENGKTETHYVDLWEATGSVS